MRAFVRKETRGGLSPLTLLLVGFFALRVLAGCSPQVAQPNLPLELILAVVNEIKRRKGLQFERGEGSPEKGPAAREIDRHKGYFVFRRVEARGVNAGNQAAITNLVEEELDELQAFVNLKLDGSTGLRQAAPDGPSGAGLDVAFTCEPGKHLDLENVAAFRRGTAATRRTIEEFKRRRVQRAQAILWRAAAVHAPLWNNGASAGNRLNEDALEELLDRRLRAVERMHNQVNSTSAAVRRTGGPRDWGDNIRVRMFEYPFFDADNFTDLVSPGDGFWSIDDSPPPESDRITFSWSVAGKVVTTRINPELNPAPGISPVWNVGADPYQRIFGSGSLSTAMITMMQPELDVWDRAWLYCDHVCVALNIDGLHFALRRRATRQSPPRPESDGQAKFDGIPATGSNFVRLHPVVGGVPNGNLLDPTTWTTYDEDSLTTDGPGGTWFQNLYVQTRDLQVGDHVVFWNHLLYVAFFNGAFRLENAIVDSIGSTHEGKIDPRAVRLAGHAMPSNSITGYAKEMADDINSGILDAQERAVREAAAGNDRFRTPQGFLVFRWVPYPGIDVSGNPGPWFVWCPLDFGFVDHPTPYPIFWPDVPTMLKAIKHSLIDDPDPSSDHNPKPTGFTVDGVPYNLTRAGVMFPLFLPFDSSGSMEWMDYFQRRRDDDDLEVGLARLTVSSSAVDPDSAIGVSGDIPGFYMAGPEPLPIQVLRPTPRLTY